MQELCDMEVCMEQIIENITRFSIEFAKLVLVSISFFDIHPKKKIITMYAESLFLVTLIACWYDLSEFCVLYSVIAIFIISVCSDGKHRVGMMVLSYIGISIFDMLSASLFSSIFYLNLEEMHNNSIVNIGANSISIIVIICILCLKKEKKFMPKISGAMLPVYIIGGISLSISLTGLLVMGLGDIDLSYRYGIIIGLSMTTIIFIVICILLNYNQNENERLKMENEMNNKLLEAQHQYYLMLLKKDTETKAFRHDMKEHIACIRLLYQKERYEELGLYISEIEETTAELSSKLNTGNDYVNAIVMDLSNQYSEVKLEWLGMIPSLKITYMDICTLFFNLLKNAFEAANTCAKKEVQAVIRVQDNNLIISISNYYETIKFDKNKELISTKTGEEHGYGIRNIKKCVEKNNGSYTVTTNNSVFHTEILLLNAIKYEISE